MSTKLETLYVFVQKDSQAKHVIEKVNIDTVFLRADAMCLYLESSRLLVVTNVNSNPFLNGLLHNVLAVFL